MGAGKSTLGKQLAKRLQYDFEDLDKYIELKNNCSITSFFQKYGERIFRKEERHRLMELAAKDNIVIAVGGGTPCFKNNMDLMNHFGETVFIDPPVNFLFQRLKDKTTSRPLLANKTTSELLDFITESHKQRLPYYLKAQHRIQAQNIKADDLLPFFN